MNNDLLTKAEWLVASSNIRYVYLSLINYTHYAAIFASIFKEVVAEVIARQKSIRAAEFLY
ncbi:MAG: hypothetical protein A3I83_00350 [Methylotenera sp. RIFCSPLOWO2_02_FULL_45_14]|nr:MAG: hypothetical protein A3I83_00350 [Methylotenera sp. RIFCSPLOWO2_02_FULL_45_14]